MPSFTLTALVPWIISHGYFLFFIACIIEGPIVTAAAGVTAALGYYNIIIIILISIAGDLVADTIYYCIGYYSRGLLIERYGHHFGATKERMEKIGKMVHKHFKKTMLIIKLSPIIPVPGLIAIGASKAPLRKFIQMSLLVTVPRSIFFALLGFYSGKTYIYLTDTITSSSYAAGGIILVVVIIYFVYKAINSQITKKVEIE